MEEILVEAALAVAYAKTIRRVPETARGFGKLAAKHQARVAALAFEISAGVDRQRTDPTPVVVRIAQHS